MFLHCLYIHLQLFCLPCNIIWQYAQWLNLKEHHWTIQPSCTTVWMNRILIMRGTWLASRLEAPSYRGTASSGAYEVFCLFQLGGVHIFLERRDEMVYFNFSLWAFFTFVGQTCIPCNMHKLGFMKRIYLGKTTISIWIWWHVDVVYKYIVVFSTFPCTNV